MSRKFDRRARINRAASQMIATGFRRKPWFVPKFAWLLLIKILIP